MILLYSMPGGLEWMLIFGMLFLFLIPYLLFLKTIQSTLERVAIENREMSPGSVWMMLIPLFNIIYQFIVAQRLADSLRNEFASRQMTVEEERPTYALGLSMAITNCLMFVPVIKTLASLVVLVLFVWYWIRIVKYKKLVELPTFDSI